VAVAIQIRFTADIKLDEITYHQSSEWQLPYSYVLQQINLDKITHHWSSAWQLPYSYVSLQWAFENAMKINPSKSKAVCFTRARVKDPLDYSLANTLIPEASSCKYLGIILCSDLSWADQVNYTVKKAWKALHFTMRILKKGNSNNKSLAYMSLVRPILEYGAACWDPYREGQITALRGAKESGQICTSYEQFELGNFGVA
jgi:hypothetical protein